MAGVFREAVLTTKGIALLAKAQAGECTINLTKPQQETDRIPKAKH